MKSSQWQAASKTLSLCMFVYFLGTLELPTPTLLIGFMLLFISAVATGLCSEFIAKREREARKIHFKSADEINQDIDEVTIDG